VARNRKQDNNEVGERRKRETTLKLSARKSRKSVSIIGAGRLGTALALALSVKGYAIDAVVSRRRQDARRAARMIGPATKLLTMSQLSALPPSKILFITTVDDAIDSVAGRIAVAIKKSGQGRVALHTSGALSSDSLIKLRDIGFRVGSMHPLVSISDPHAGAKSLSLARFCIEGEPQAVRVARSIVRVLGGKGFSIKTSDKALYHAAAVMSSGHVVALFDIATEILTNCGLTKTQAKAALLPLLKSTIENLQHHTPSRALTGTFARADTATVIKHLEALGTNAEAGALAAYKLLGLRSLQLARESGADLANIKKIRQILQKE